MMKNNNVKLVIFDLDGTLVDAYKAIELSFNYARKKFGLPPIEGIKIRKAVGWGDRNLLKPFFPARLLNKAVNTYRSHHKAALIKYSKVFGSTKKVLSGLKKNKIKLAIATNRPTRFSYILIRHLGIYKYFDAVLCADKIKSYKPSPEILLKIMKRLKVTPDETVYVGDMAVDVRTGKNASVKVISVLTGSSTRKELIKAKPYKIIKDISFLIRAINI